MEVVVGRVRMEKAWGKRYARGGIETTVLQKKKVGRSAAHADRM